MVPRLVVLVECEYLEADALESQFIKNFKSNGQCELNLAGGGKGNRSVSRFNNTHMDDWVQIGRKVKLVRTLLLELMTDLGHAAGPKAQVLAIEVLHSVDNMACKLDARLAARFPQWQDFFRVFYGEVEPTGDGGTDQ
jgi:hypothetical protein